MVAIRLEEGDLSEARVDAIVNAVATDLVLQGGPGWVLVERGGPAIEEECRRLGPVSLGEAVITGAGKLAARQVIHVATREPGAATEEPALRAAMRSSLELARTRGLRSLAFPALGAEGGGLTLQRSAEIMLEEVRRAAAGETLEEVRFVLRGEPAYRVFEQVHDAERIRSQMDKLRR